ncbi:MAG: ribosomal protein S18-alanine N-acetyltransferase [Erysipelotrichales bacterium]
MIRVGNIDDIEQILDIHKSLFKVPYTYSSFKFDIEDKYNIFHIYEKNNIIVGYFSFKILVDEGELITIAVKKDHQNEGIATLLLDDLISNAQQINLKNIFLEVSEHNKIAQKLYKNFGFEYTYTRYLYYGKDDNAYIYKKGLM